MTHNIKPWDIILSQIILEELPKKEWSKIRRFRCECLNCWKVADKFLSCLSQAKTWCSCTHWKWNGKRESKWTPEQKKVLSTWQSMKERCYNTKSKSYYLYWEKWITVCDEWINNFEQFYADMWPRPDGMSIDRIDWTKWYCKENCKWADRKTQNNNRSYCTMIWDITLSQWAENVWIDTNTWFYSSHIHSLYKKWHSLDEILEKYQYHIKHKGVLDIRTEEEKKNWEKNYQKTYYETVTKQKRREQSIINKLNLPNI